MYIYEQDDWPNFYWDEVLVLNNLLKIKHEQGILYGRMSALGFDLQKEASYLTLSEDIIKTSEIEGEILNKEEVRSSVANRLGFSILNPTVPSRHVDGIVELIIDATSNYNAPLTQERLFSWHASLFPTGYSGIHKISVASYRNDKSGKMQVVSGFGKEKVHFTAPDASKIPNEMKAFLNWIEKSDLDLILKAGIAHLWFVTIHPFDDGNGRITRAITDMLLSKSEKSKLKFYSMSAEIMKDRKNYYAILEKAQKSSLDITEWLLWFLNCLLKSFQNIQSISENVLLKAKFWNQFQRDSFNQRQQKVIHKLLDGFEGALTSSKWAKITKCSQDTAYRDIIDLVDRKILIKDEAGGRSTNYLFLKLTGFSV